MKLDHYVNENATLQMLFHTCLMRVYRQWLLNMKSMTEGNKAYNIFTARSVQNNNFMQGLA